MRPARLLYSLLFYLAMPFILLRLFWRGRAQPEYRRHWRERLALYRLFARPLRPRYRRRPPDAAPLIWLHAVSLGETRAAESLIESLLAAYPGYRLLLTSTTPTGRAAGQVLCETLGTKQSRILQAWLPYDLPGATRRFLAHFRPALGILMETEIWPNLLAAAAAHRLPVVLANARLSRASARAYARIHALIRPALGHLAAVTAQSEADANRLALLGAPNIHICGNLKFDMLPDPGKLRLGETWRAALADRLVWLAASTREGEEELLCAIQRTLAGHPAFAAKPPLLVLVPRHPQRFDAVAGIVARHGLSLCRRSQRPPAEELVWLGDSMGEMPAYYRLAQISFIGGSLLPLGGQNLIEAASCASPILIGPHTFNFTQASRDAIRLGAARRVADAGELAEALIRLLPDEAARKEMRTAALAFAARYQGATAKNMEYLTAILPPPQP
jgi:3-deoxy-D-manno-octulosonic-acid transferase